MLKKITLLLFMFLLILPACKKPQLKKYEIRAVWMSRFEYAQGKSAQQSKAFIRKAFQKFHKAGINLILFQVRGNADAFYHSNYEPWSNLLSDSLGKDPGWDPLQFALQEAHSLGLELHAWINTFPAWKAENPPPAKSEPLHPLLAHPEWLVCDSAGNPMHPKSGYITFSPGNPQVQKHIQNVVFDIVENYDVDGVHFDYIRYPEGANKLGYSHDSVTVARFADSLQNRYKFALSVWQREQVNQFLATAYNGVTTRKPWVKVSAAVLGHAHSAPWNGYHSVYQDARRWLSTGKIDLLFLMTYTAIDHPVAPYTQAIEQWQALRHLGRYIVPGIAVYKLGKQFTPREVYNQMDLLREKDFPGMVFFAATNLLKTLNRIQEKYYPAPALTPPLNWKKDVPLTKAFDLQLRIKNNQLHFSWQADSGNWKFVLYNNKVINDPEHIVKIINGTQRSFSLPLPGKDRDYYLTAINRVGMESPPVRFSKDALAVLKE